MDFYHDLNFKFIFRPMQIEIILVLSIYQSNVFLSKFRWLRYNNYTGMNTCLDFHILDSRTIFQSDGSSKTINLKLPQVFFHRHRVCHSPAKRHPFMFRSCLFELFRIVIGRVYMITLGKMY